MIILFAYNDNIYYNVEKVIEAMWNKVKSSDFRILKPIEQETIIAILLQKNEKIC